MNRNMTFIRLFYKQQGLSGTQMGLLGTTASIIGLISAPLIGRVSDNVSHLNTNSLEV